jgi:drug/metabolite transporter (DMT)-like permease
MDGSSSTENIEQRINKNEKLHLNASDAQGTQGISYYLSRFNPLHFHKRAQKTKAIFALLLVCFFWGTTWLASKEGVRHMPALQLAAIRQFFGGLCYIIFFLSRGARWPQGKEWLVILTLSFLNFMLSNSLSTWGVQYIPAGLGSIIGAIFPMWLVIIGLFGTRTKTSAGTLIGLLLGFAGICVIFYEHLHQFLNASFRFGIILSVLSTWTWAFGTLYTKKTAASFNPYFSLGLQMAISGMVLYAVATLSGFSVPVDKIPIESWAAIGYLVVFGSVITFIAYLYALQNLPTEQVSIYAYINPVVAVVLGWIIFKEPLTGFIVIGTIITLYGVYLVNKTAKKLK